MTKWINTIKWNESKAHWWPWNLHLDRVVILNVYTAHATSIITNSILFSQHFLSMHFMSGVPLLLEVKWRKASYLSLMSPPTGGGSHMNTRCCYSTVSELIMIDIKCNSPTWQEGAGLLVRRSHLSWALMITRQIEKYAEERRRTESKGMGKGIGYS